MCMWDQRSRRQSFRGDHIYAHFGFSAKVRRIRTRLGATHWVARNMNLKHRGTETLEKSKVDPLEIRPIVFTTEDSYTHLDWLA